MEHAHPHEQVMYVISGKLSVDLDGEHAELGPGMGFHAKPNQKHRVQAVEDTQVISSKHVIDGIGHKISSGGDPIARVDLIAGDADLTPEGRSLVGRLVETRGEVSRPFQVLLHSPAARRRGC